MNAKIIRLLPQKSVKAVQVGGKGQGLLNLINSGLPIPPGFIISPDYFPPLVKDWLKAHHKTASDHQKKWQQLLQEPNLSPIWQPIEAAYHQLEQLGKQKDLPVAVRSSALGEDSQQHSFAGLYDTYLWVAGIRELLPKIAACWASLFNERAIVYRLERQITAVPQMAVIVQQMVPAESSGVMMTLNPANGDRSKIVIEATWGLGQPLVEGTITPDRFMLDKVTGQLISAEIASKTTALRPSPTLSTQPVPIEKQNSPAITNDQLQQLWQYGRQLEGYFGAPQDIEFALAQNNIYLLQSRPETYWQQQPQQKINLPTQPIDQVVAALTTFGKKKEK